MKAHFISRRGVLCMFLFLGAMLLAGTFLDYPISSALYDEKNIFGRLLAGYGEYPAALGFTAAGVLLLAGRSRESRRKKYLQSLGGIFLIVSGTFMLMCMPMLYLTVPKVIPAASGLLCSAAVIAGISILGKNTDKKILLRVAAMIFFTIMLEILAVNLIKIPWGRPRMRLVYENAQACFMPWWQAGSSLKGTLTAAGVAAEEFKSFPSGHTANASMLMLLGILPMLRPKLANKRTLLIGIGFAWPCLVAASRIIMGAHYLTDTTVGFAIGLTAMLLVWKAVFGRQKVQSTIQNKG